MVFMGRSKKACFECLDQNELGFGFCGGNRIALCLCFGRNPLIFSAEIGVGLLVWGSKMTWF